MLTVIYYTIELCIYFRVLQALREEQVHQALRVAEDQQVPADQEGFLVLLEEQ